MVYTIFNALGTEPTAWRDGKLLSKISLTIPAEDEAYAGHFWPWRASEVEKHVHNLPNGRFKVEAFDYYHNGNFMDPTMSWSLTSWVTGKRRCFSSCPIRTIPSTS